MSGTQDFTLGAFTEGPNGICTFFFFCLSFFWPHRENVQNATERSKWPWENTGEAAVAT